jgi:hypothetical protein
LAAIFVIKLSISKQRCTVVPERTKQDRLSLLKRSDLAVVLYGTRLLASDGDLEGEKFPELEASYVSRFESAPVRSRELRLT